MTGPIGGGDDDELAQLDSELDERQRQLEDDFDRDPLGFLWFDDRRP